MNLPDKKESEGLQDKVVSLRRVAKVVKGGRRFSFSALVVVGDSAGKVGYGVGKAGEVPDAIKKASEHAKKNLLDVKSKDGTIPFEVIGRHGSARVMMYPAKAGKGVIAGGSTRAVVELAGIKDIVCKIHGTKNSQSVVRATIDGLEQLKTIEEYCQLRGKEPHEIFQKR